MAEEMGAGNDGISPKALELELRGNGIAVLPQNQEGGICVSFHN